MSESYDCFAYDVLHDPTCIECTLREDDYVLCSVRVLSPLWTLFIKLVKLI
jgi:hypothetical protein